MQKITLIILFMTLSNLSNSQAKIERNHNVNAKELKYSLNVHKDQLSIWSFYTIKNVKIISEGENVKYSKMHFVRDRNIDIDIRKFRKGSYRVLVSCNNKLIIFKLIILKNPPDKKLNRIKI